MNSLLIRGISVDFPGTKGASTGDGLGIVRLVLGTLSRTAVIRDIACGQDVDRPVVRSIQSAGRTVTGIPFRTEVPDNGSRAK